jgi:acyl carrier protein
MRLTGDAVLDVVRDALVVVLEVDGSGVDRRTTFTELQADSLALVEVAEIVEERLAPHTSPAFRIPDADLESLQTVGDAVDLVLARL